MHVDFTPKLGQMSAKFPKSSHALFKLEYNQISQCFMHKPGQSNIDPVRDDMMQGAQAFMGKVFDIGGCQEP